MRDWWACDGCGERVTRDGNVLVKELAAQLAAMTARAEAAERDRDALAHYHEGFEDGGQAKQDQIVAWLRSTPEPKGPTPYEPTDAHYNYWASQNFADAIERGEYEKASE